MPFPRQTLYLVRHGETLWNAEGRIQGQGDSELTAHGIEQARAYGRTLARQLGNGPPFLMIRSPLGRVRHTADLMLETLAPMITEVRIDDRLKEIAYGTWEGSTHKEIAAADPATFAARSADPWRVAPPGAESYADLQARVVGWFRSVGDEPRVVAVAHGGVMRALLGHLKELTPQETVRHEAPQDAFFRIEDGFVTRIPSAP